MILLLILNTFFTIAVEFPLSNIANKDYLVCINELSQCVTSTVLIMVPIICGEIINFIDMMYFNNLRSLIYFEIGDRR